MEAMTESWTDGRMDDLSAKVDELGRRMENGFNRLDADVRALRDDTKTEFGAVRSETKKEFAAVRVEMRKGFEMIEKRFDKIDARFDKVDERFQKADERFERYEVRSDERFEAMMDRLYSMQRLMIQFCGAAMVALIGFLATLIGFLVT